LVSKAQDDPGTHFNNQQGTGVTQTKQPLNEPYLIFNAGTIEQTLPVITAEGILRAFDWEDGFPQHRFGLTEMIWDTGASTTFITEEMLPSSFRDHLNHPIHDAYKSLDGSTVQMEFLIKFPTFPQTIDVVALVRSQSKMPTHFLGIIFGQKLSIERMKTQSIPQAILEATEQEVVPGAWGRIIVENYLDLDDTLHVL
jgi:hypothetical protein